MPVLPFESDADVAEFAGKFLGEHVERFDKDIAICLQPDENGSHAYFPALITCTRPSFDQMGLLSWPCTWPRSTKPPKSRA